jgi:hypothetical protein
MTETPITIADIAVVCAIAAAVFGIVIKGIDLLTKYITNITGKADMTRAEQSAQCQFDHASIGSILTQQNANIVRLLEQNGKMLEQMSEANHAAQLRHQIILNHLENLHTKISKT